MTHEIAAQIDAIEVSLNAGGMNTINIVLAFVMYGVALGIKPKMFVEVFRKPKSVLLGMLCQLVLLPAFTCGLAIAMGSWISPMMGLGMILVAACPGGNISNFMSSLGKANIELSVSLTAISTALAVLMTPFNFWLWGNIYLDTAAVAADVPKLVIPLWDVFKTIFILLGIPRHPDLTVPAEDRRKVEKASAVGLHHFLHGDGRALLQQQHGRLPAVRQVHLRRGPDP